MKTILNWLTQLGKLQTHTCNATVLPKISQPGDTGLIDQVYLTWNVPMLVSLNQYHEENEGLHNQSTSQITELTFSLFDYLVNFTENALVYIILMPYIFF